jgi:hypothetical protein
VALIVQVVLVLFVSTLNVEIQFNQNFLPICYLIENIANKEFSNINACTLKGLFICKS